MKKFFVSACLLLCLVVPVFADPSVDEIIANLQANQAMIKDMSADTITTITSTMKGMKSMTQKGKILMKYPDKSRVEMFEPIHQVTINDGKKIIMINKDTGQRTEQRLPVALNSGQMNLEKAKEQFDFSVRNDGEKYIITGTPRTDNKFLGKMEIVIDTTVWLAKTVKVFTPQGKVISESAMEYAKFGDVWVLSKTISNASVPMGNMKMEMEYQNVQINRGIKDNEFEK